MLDDIIKIGNEIQLYPEAISRDAVENLDSYSIGQIASLGLAFEPLAQAINQIVNSGESSTGLYRVTLPKGATHLAKLKSGAGNIGTALDEKNKIVGQAVLSPAAFNPAMVFMAVTIINIDMKLDAITETQKEMKEFLEQKEESELIGSMDFLKDLLENYKYNWNNKRYKNSAHTKTFDIMETSQRKINFYTEQIKSKIQNKDYLHSKFDASKLLDKIQRDFKDLQIALHLYSHSSLVGILLLDNYNRDYLDSIVNKINDYSFEYRKLYTEAYDYIEEYVDSSVWAYLMSGAAFLSEGAGKVIEKIPLINRLQIDESLQKTGTFIDEKREDQRDDMMQSFVHRQSDQVKPFVDSIQAMNRTHNDEYEIMFDKDKIYLSRYNLVH